MPKPAHIGNRADVIAFAGQEREAEHVRDFPGNAIIDESFCRAAIQQIMSVVVKNNKLQIAVLIQVIPDRNIADRHVGRNRNQGAWTRLRPSVGRAPNICIVKNQGGMGTQA